MSRFGKYSSSGSKIRVLEQAYSLRPKTKRSIWKPEASTGKAHCEQPNANFFFMALNHSQTVFDLVSATLLCIVIYVL